MRVLVLDGNENQAVACVRSLAGAGHHVSVGAATRWSKAGWSRDCSDTFMYPAPQHDADGFVAAVGRQVGREPGTLVLPMTERTTLPLSRHREAIQSARGLLVLPPHEVVLRAFDKAETTRLAESLGIEVPRTLMLASGEEARAEAAMLGYPVVLKPRSSEEDTGCGAVRSTGAPVYARNEAEFLRGWADLWRRCRAVVVQEFVEGVGAGFFALMNHGELRAEFAHERIRDVRPTGSGSALRVSTLPAPALREQALAILRALEWHGVAMVEFRVRADGTPVFLEVNGRFWNSLALAVHAGVDFPALVARLAVEGDVEPVSSYRVGVRTRWLLGDVRHLVEVWRGAPAGFPGSFPRRLPTLAAVVTPVRGTYHDNFALRDPLPELGDWLDFALHRVPRREARRQTATDGRPRGVLHVHSTYSDGDFTLEELRSIFVAAGCQFACVSDHADSFDARKLSAYLDECRDRSDEAFRFIPGLEYTCMNRMHVLGYGATFLPASADPQEVIQAIARAGGIAVIAHPKDEAFGWIESFETLPNGIEAWNTKYDGRYAPRPATFALLARLKARRPDMTAFYGQDLHWRKQHRGLFVTLNRDPVDREGVLQALRAGDYAGEKDGMRLPSNGQLDPALLARFARMHERSQRMRRWVKRAKAWADGVGLIVPGAMKAQLRRMF
jgi:predicted ATP-grasp superfamily ATP-dependent carboligase